MAFQSVRTDLAVEAKQLWQESVQDSISELPGVRAVEERREGFLVSTIEILDSEGEQALGKPVGTYITIELDGLFRREENSFSLAASLLSENFRSLSSSLDAQSYLVVGLGNREITPDALGPQTVDHVLITRHLKKFLPDEFAKFQSVAAICSGVLGTTGIESSDLVHALMDQIRPSLVFAVAALAARGLDRLCRTVQISNTGIIPGSGVGNARLALNQENLGVPVIAVGVPTVVDAATMTVDLARRAGSDLRTVSFGELGNLIVTPRDIDKRVSDISKLIGYALNLAFHPGLTLEELDLLLS